jgi:hypothetical protein
MCRICGFITKENIESPIAQLISMNNEMSHRESKDRGEEIFAKIVTGLALCMEDYLFQTFPLMVISLCIQIWWLVFNGARRCSNIWMDILDCSV